VRNMRFLNRPLLAGLVLAGCAVLLYLWPSAQHALHQSVWVYVTRSYTAAGTTRRPSTRAPTLKLRTRADLLRCQDDTYSVCCCARVRRSRPQLDQPQTVHWRERTVQHIRRRRLLGHLLAGAWRPTIVRRISGEKKPMTRIRWAALLVSYAGLALLAATFIAGLRFPIRPGERPETRSSPGSGG
jgi:hypothetical protein